MGADKVGYKRPPRSTQFKPGRSGNPKGRPKGTRNLKSDLHDEFAETMNVREQGHSKTITKQRAFIKSLMAKAVQGDARAANTLLNMTFRLLRPDLAEDPPAELSVEDRAIVDTFVVRRRQLGTGQNPTNDKGGQNKDAGEST